jgi:hypothetical protein
MKIYDIKRLIWENQSIEQESNWSKISDQIHFYTNLIRNNSSTSQLDKFVLLFQIKVIIQSQNLNCIQRTFE